MPFSKVSKAWVSRLPASLRFLATVPLELVAVQGFIEVLREITLTAQTMVPRLAADVCWLR